MENGELKCKTGVCMCVRHVAERKWMSAYLCKEGAGGWEKMTESKPKIKRHRS